MKETAESLQLRRMNEWITIGASVRLSRALALLLVETADDLEQAISHLGRMRNVGRGTVTEARELLVYLRSEGRKSTLYSRGEEE